MDSLQAVFPGWQIGLESPPRLLKAGRDTTELMRIWLDIAGGKKGILAGAEIKIATHPGEEVELRAEN